MVKPPFAFRSLLTQRQGERLIRKRMKVKRDVEKMSRQRVRSWKKRREEGRWRSVRPPFNLHQTRHPETREKQEEAKKEERRDRRKEGRKKRDRRGKLTSPAPPSRSAETTSLSKPTNLFTRPSRICPKSKAKDLRPKGGMGTSGEGWIRRDEGRPRE